MYRGARQFNEPGVIVLFEVAPDKLIRDAALFGWDLRELERDGRLKMIFTTRQLFQQEVQQAASPLLAEAAEIGVCHYDADFDVIASVTGQPVRAIAPLGSL